MLASPVIMEINFYGLSIPVAEEAIRQKLAGVLNEDRVVSISFNHDPIEKLPKSDYRVLILWEPSAVMPWQYKEENRELFDLVIPLSPWRAKRLGYQVFTFHPYSAPREFISPWEKRENKVVMINAAKFSAGPNGNYGLRRAASRALHRSGVDYSLYGHDWDMSLSMEILKRLVALRNSIVARERIDFSELTSNLFYNYPEYRGGIQDKIDLLGKVELSLVIENESDYVTEKLFDSICAGAVPVYVGPELGDEFQELNRCLIKAQASVEDIVDTVKNISRETLETKKSAIVDYLKLTDNRGINFWRPERVWGRVGNIVRSALDNRFTRKSS